MNPHQDMRVAVASQRVNEARESYKHILFETITTCSHGQIGECDYRHMEWIASLPPRRTCLCCGLTEDGWGCGYIVLRVTHPQKWSRDDLAKQTTVVICDDDKGPLLRNEKSVSEIVRARLGLHAAPTHQPAPQTSGKESADLAKEEHIEWREEEARLARQTSAKEGEADGQ